MQDHINATAASAASYTASGSLIIFGMTADDAASVVIIISGIVGIAIGLATLCINWYYQAKRSQ